MTSLVNIVLQSQPVSRGIMHYDLGFADMPAGCDSPLIKIALAAYRGTTFVLEKHSV